MKSVVKATLRPMWIPLRRKIEQMIDARLAAQGEAWRDSVRMGKTAEQLHEIESTVAHQARELEQLHNELSALRHSTYSPDPAAEQISADAPFLVYSNCQAVDFQHPRYAALSKLIGDRPHYHRKQWEWIFILHKLIESGVLQSGSRGLVFGVGREPLPAAFASMGVFVTATDAPMHLSSVGAWSGTNQHSDGLEALSYPGIVPDDILRRQVRHDFCDMNAIDPKFQGFDFNWSSCCFEHLGSLEAGLQFVINAVEKTLRMGGVGVHTTEYNASSNDNTVEVGDTVIYRRRDMEELVSRLRARGHEVEEFRIGPTAHALDFFVDTPPYKHNVHLKLLLASYVTTSAGIVVRRGR